MRDLQFCCWYQSWTYCPKCQKLKTRKLQPAFRRKTPSPLHNACKCGIEDVPLILGNLTRGNCNRWNTLVFANATHPNAGNLKTYFPPRLGRPATPSMASQPQHLLDQTKGIRSRQIPCWCQVRVSIQSHVLLPASHNEPSSSFSFWIETSWRREHATHHKVLCTSHCPPDTWGTGDTITDQFEHEGRAQRIFHQHHRRLRHVPTRHPLPVEDPHGKWWSRRLIINFNGELIPSLATPKGNLKRHHYCPDVQTADPGTILWRRYPGNLQLAHPGTCKSQVLICAIHYAIEEEMSVLVAAQVALLA